LPERLPAAGAVVVVVVTVLVKANRWPRSNADARRSAA
jgi:hypothetical protein